MDYNHSKYSEALKLLQEMRDDIISTFRASPKAGLFKITIADGSTVVGGLEPETDISAGAICADLAEGVVRIRYDGASHLLHQALTKMGVPHVHDHKAHQVSMNLYYAKKYLSDALEVQFVDEGAAMRRWKRRHSSLER